MTLNPPPVVYTPEPGGVLPSDECWLPRCSLPVARVTIVPAGTGKHRPAVVDPEPTTWEQGGRYALMPHQPTAGTTFVRAYTAATVAQAFGIDGKLYRPHGDSCGGGTGKRTKSREADG